MNSIPCRSSTGWLSRKARGPGFFGPLALAACLGIGFAGTSRGEAMLELFQMNWTQISQKMPEIAEAGYDSLWVPNPAKGNSGSYSIGYDVFDPFDLGGTNQQGTVATKYGTQDQLIQMVETAHRFGIRVYFDNVMNHRSSSVPGNYGNPTNYYPGLIPQDFHLQVISGGYQNWSSVSDWCSAQNVQNNPLLGLCDLANEPGTVNWNFGPNYGNTANKPLFTRFPGRADLYMDTNLPAIGGKWHPFDGHGQPSPEYVQDYLSRAAAWTLYVTKADGFRLDAVKHVPAGFFGTESGQTDDPSFAGYTGAIQAMYDYVHGYGTNVTGNGYVETDGNRNSLFNTEATRNDAMIFGEYIPSALSAGADFYDYLNSGMRLLNQPLYNQLNSVIGGSSMAGMDGRDYIPPGQNCDANGNFSAAQAVNMPQTQDGGTCCPANPGMEDAYLFMHEGLPGVYSDGFNHNAGGGTPIVSYANYLGEFHDNSMPDIMYLHNQLARGGTHGRWGDQNIVAFERYDNREGSSSQNQGVVLFAMNANFGNPGDEYFVDGINDILPTSYAVPVGANGTMQGMVVSFPPGSVLHQLATSTPGYDRTFSTVTVRTASNNHDTAAASGGSIVFVGGQAIPAGGGAIEFMIPSGGWVMYGYQWPEASRANVATNAIIIRQNGVEVPHIIVNRTDGPNGDTGYNPLFPFKMRGSVDPFGNVITNKIFSNRTYAIDIPVVTNANFDIVVRSDASCVNTLVKLDGGMDLNSQMSLGPTGFQAGIAPTNFLDLRDNKPGYATDVFLGYEQTTFQFRNGPEKFAAKNTLSNNIVSLGAETYYYTVGGASNIVAGSGYGQSINNQTATFVYHDPAAPVTATNNALATQRMPLSPTAGQSADIYVKVGYQFQINTCFLYYTIDGSNPEGAFGVGKGTTQVVQGHFLNHDNPVGNIDWWKATIPAQPNGTQVRYKVALFNGGSVYGDQSILPISDTDASGSRHYGLTQAAITNFNPTTAVIWLHNDLSTSNTATGLQSGFHIVRARTFLPRTNQSSVYNTFLQTIYYDGALPTGVIAFPTNNTTITNRSYTVVVRGDSTVSGVDFNIDDGNPSNDDGVTGQANGNGLSNGVPSFANANPVTPNSTLSAQYPNYPVEYRFVYTNVPTSGTATITVRLKEFSTGVYTNRFTTLTASVTNQAPVSVVQISSPAIDGTVLAYFTNTTYLVRACFSTGLASAQSNFNILINGVLQPQASYTIRPAGALGVNVCPGLKSISYNWNSPALGTNLIQVIFTNGAVISDDRLVIVAPPPQISGLDNNNQLVVWDSIPGVNYQVLATTNLLLPFLPIGDPVPASGGSSTVFYDPDPSIQKYYEIQMLP